MRISQNAAEMAPEKLPTKEQLIEDLTAFCKEGYLVSRAKPSLQGLENLVGLRIAGGPGRPENVIGWGERREVLRALLKEVAETEVRTALGPEYAEATIKLFRLDKRKPVERHLQENLNDLQERLLDGVRRQAFRDEHRSLILEVVAAALIKREEAAAPSDDPAEAEVTEEPGPDSLDKGEVAPAANPEDAEPDEEADSTQSTEPSEREAQPAEDAIPPPLDPGQPSEPIAPRSRQPSGTARALIVIVSLIGIAAAALLIARSQPSDSGSGASATTETQPRETSPPSTATSDKKSPTASAVPPIDFTAEVVNWCYCGDADTLESQIKIKPRFVNHSARRIDLRTGGSARLGLAIFAKASSDRSWISPTTPRYRRFGRWLAVPPNAPGDLTSPTMFETHWEPSALRPFGAYLDPDFYEGDLVFNVPPDLSLGGYRVRLAYRLRSGELYFPRKGAAWQWQGGEEGNQF